MLSGVIFTKLGHFTKNIRDNWIKRSEKNLKPKDINIENYQYESHRYDDMPLTISKDPGPRVKYSYTENSEFARGAEKTEAIGIDNFDDEDAIDPEEADDYQDFRNRKQNSDLSKRYYTHGLDFNEDEFH